MIANGYAHRMPHKPSSNRFDSGPQIFRKSFEFQPNGNATHPTIMLIAVNEKKNAQKSVNNRGKKYTEHYNDTSFEIFDSIQRFSIFPDKIQNLQGKRVFFAHICDAITYLESTSLFPFSFHSYGFAHFFHHLINDITSCSE